MLFLLFLTFSVLVANPKKPYLHGGQSRSWSAREKRTKGESLPAPPTHAARTKENKNKTQGTYNQDNRENGSPEGHHVTHLQRLCATKVLVRLAPGQDSFGSSIRSNGVVSQVLRFHVRYQFSQSRCLFLLLAAFSRVYLFFLPRGHKPPPTHRERLNSHFRP